MLRAAAAETRIFARHLISAIDQQVPHEQEDQGRMNDHSRPEQKSGQVCNTPEVTEIAYCDRIKDK
jgi:hypothetical protein